MLAELARSYVEASASGYAAVMRAIALVCALTAMLLWAVLRPAGAMPRAEHATAEHEQSTGA